MAEHWNLRPVRNLRGNDALRNPVERENPDRDQGKGDVTSA
jgi:hypothetical protein